MNPELGRATSVEKYLIKRYKIRKQSINDEISIVKQIQNDHDIDDLLVIKRRIDKSKSLQKAPSEMKVDIYSLLPVAMTLFITIIIGFITSSTNFLNSLLATTVNFKKDSLSDENFSELINSIDFSPIYDVLIQGFILIFLVFGLMLIVVDFFLRKKTSKLYYCSLLIDEAIEMKNNTNME